MNYGKIVEDSFGLAWKYKSLWIFGLFAGSFGDFNFQYETEEQFDFSTLESASYQGVMEYLAPILAAVFVLVLVLSLLRIICFPALVDGINKIARGGTYKFWDSYSRGLDFFWRYLGLNVLLFAAMGGFVLVSFVLVAAVHLLMLLLVIPLFIVFAFIVTSVFGLAERSLIVRDSSMGDAIEEGWLLFKNNMGKCLIILLIIFGLVIGLGIVLALLGFLLYLPINLIVGSIAESLGLIFVLALILGLPVSIVLGGFGGTFFVSLYTLFYFGLVDPSTPYAAKPLAAPAPTQP